MGTKYYSFKDVANLLHCSEEELVKKGVSSEIVFMLPFSKLDGKHRYIYPVDLLDLSDDEVFGGKETTDIILVALTPDEARTMKFYDESDSWTEDSELVYDPINPPYDDISLNSLFVTQDEIDRYINQTPIEVIKFTTPDERLNKAHDIKHGQSRESAKFCVDQAKAIWDEQKMEDGIYRMGEMADMLDKELEHKGLWRPADLSTIKNWLKKAEKDGEIIIPSEARKPGR